MTTTSRKAAPPFPAGLTDRYQPIEVLGSGAMGSVFLARDLRHDREVAVKLIQGGNRFDAREARFRREATTLAAVHSPHVVALYDHGTVDEGPYLVMERIRGKPLDEAGEGFDPLEAMLQVATGLDAIHDQDLVHRDLKPANILWSQERGAVIVDFGLAYDPDRTRITRDAAVVGTLAYLCPVCTAMTTPRATGDWYAWGVTLYALREKRLPFLLPDLMEAFQGKALPPVAFRRLEPGSAEARLIRRCLSQKIEDRPYSRASVERILEEAAGARGSVGETEEIVSGTKPGPALPGPGRTAGSEPGRGLGRATLVGPAISGSGSGAPIQGPGRAGSPQARLALLAACLLAAAFGLGVWSGPGAVPGPGKAGSAGPGAGTGAGDPGSGPGGLGFDDGFLVRAREVLTPERIATLDRDPDHWGTTLRSLRPVREIHEAVAEGLAGGSLDPRIRDGLRELDAGFRSLALPEPFGPLVEPEPEPEPLPRPALMEAPEYRPLGVPDKVGGWLGRGLTALDRAARLQVAADRELAAHREGDRPPPAYPQDLWDQRRSLPTGSLWDLARAVSARPPARTALAPVLRPGARALAEAWFALGRAARAGGDDGELAALVLTVQSTRMSAWLYDGFLEADLGALLGGPPDTPAAALVHGWIDKVREVVRVRRGREPDAAAPLRQARLFARAAELPEVGPRTEVGAGAVDPRFRARRGLGLLHWAFARYQDPGTSLGEVASILRVEIPGVSEATGLAACREFLGEARRRSADQPGNGLPVPDPASIHTIDACLGAISSR